MKSSLSRFFKIASGAAALAFLLMLPTDLCAQSNSAPVPAAAKEGGIIHTILREGDPNFTLAGRPRNGGKQRHQHGEKGRPDASRGDKKKQLDRPAERKQGDDKKAKTQPEKKKEGEAPKCLDCKKGPGPQANAKPKGDCPDCKKSEGSPCEKCKKTAPPVAKKENHGIPHNPPAKWEGSPKHPQPPVANRGNQDEMRARQEEMRRRFEEMRKRGGPWAENRGAPRDARRPGDQGGPDVAKIREELERAHKELDHARQSLHMAHKELGEKALHIEKLEDQVQNFRSQLERAELAMRKLHQMEGEREELAKALQSERRKNEALQNDVTVVQKKAKEAISKIQAQAEQHVAQSQARMQAEMREHADKLRKHAAGNPPQGTARKAVPEKSQPKRPDAKSRGTTSRSPRKPEPNKPAEPAEPETLSIAPINYNQNSAVNYEERTRVLNEVTALLEKNPDATIKIIGHADDSPYEQVNRDISKNRASFLSSFLRVSGIDSKKISHEGVGNTAPAKGDTAGNRRVVIEVVK